MGFLEVVLAFNYRSTSPRHLSILIMSSDNIEKLYQNYGILADAKDEISKVTYKDFDFN